MEQIKDVMKMAITRLASKATDMDNLELEEFKETCDGIKDLAEAGYYCAITEAMEKPENQYGVNYDEHGKFYTPMRNPSNGQYMRSGYEVYDPMMRGDMEQYRDMDRSSGRMYYTDSGMMPSANNSRYDRARRGYEEVKNMDPQEDHTAEMKKIFEVLEEDMNKLKSKMTATERANARNHFTNMANSMM
ncbi:MAG: hypothetical protein KBT03_05305 [Bacteroidales bacterium]|nr:hypothetical protein [Candidatus Scybalousia scybalohippi]